MASLDDAVREMTHRFLIIKAILKGDSAELEHEFITYCNEALMARKQLDSSLRNLKPGDRVLEIGGGVLALSVQLASEGYEVTVIEPVGSGFNPILQMMEMFLSQARKEGHCLNLIQLPIEEAKLNQKFDFIFSVNVMEHLKQPYEVIRKVIPLLEQQAIYRFICPNYDFPYEPHFGAMLIARRDSAFFLSKKRAMKSNSHVMDAQGLYESLNFITLRKVRKIVREYGLVLNANNAATFNLILRAFEDTILRKRHPKLNYVLSVFRFLGVMTLTRLIPTNLQPIMDVEVSKSG